MSYTKFIEEELDGRVRVKFKVEIDLEDEGRARKTAEFLKEIVPESIKRTGMDCWIDELVAIIEGK